MRRRVTPRAAAHADMAHARGNLSGGARLSDRRHPRRADRRLVRSEEHTSELQSLMRISYAVFCLKKKNRHKHNLHPQLETYSIHHEEIQSNQANRSSVHKHIQRNIQGLVYALEND